MQWLSFNRYQDVSTESDDESYEKVLNILGIVSFCFLVASNSLLEELLRVFMGQRDTPAESLRDRTDAQ